jgi:hypothetical protein
MAGLIRAWRKTGHTGRDRGLPAAIPFRALSGSVNSANWATRSTLLRQGPQAQAGWFGGREKPG